MEENVLIKRVSELLATDYDKTSDAVHSLFQKIADLILNNKSFYIDGVGTLFIKKHDNQYSLLIEKEKKKNSIEIKYIENLETDAGIKKYYKAIISTLKYILIESDNINIKDFGVFYDDEDKLFVASKNLQDKINKKFNASKNNEIIEDINDIDIKNNNKLLKKDDDNSITEEIVEKDTKSDIDDIIKKMLTTYSENTKTNKNQKTDNVSSEDNDSSVQLIEELIEEYEEYIVPNVEEDFLDNKTSEIDDIVDNLTKNTIPNFLDNIERKSNNLDNKTVEKEKDNKQIDKKNVEEIDNKAIEKKATESNNRKNHKKEIKEATESENRKIEKSRLLKEKELAEIELERMEDFRRENRYKKIENKINNEPKQSQIEEDTLKTEELKKEERRFRRERNIHLKDKENQLLEEKMIKEIFQAKEDKLKQTNMAKFRKLKKNRNYKNTLKEEVVGMLQKQKNEKNSKILPIIIGLSVALIIIYMTSVTFKRFKAPTVAQVPTVELKQTLSDTVDNYFSSAGENPKLRYTTDKDMYFWEISKSIYGESLYWPLIFALNTEKLQSTDIVKKGTQVFYKNIPETKKKFLKNDSINTTLSKSYLYLYEILTNERRPKHAVWVARLSAYFDKDTFKKWKKRIPSSLYDNIIKNTNGLGN